jgi:hypothetical protein
VSPGDENFERIREGERVLNVENRAHLAVDLLAVFDADALFRRRRRARPVDEHADDMPLVSRRLWMSQTSSPREPATRSAIARICSSGSIGPK